MGKSTKSSGLTITRNGDWFTFTWKNPKKVTNNDLHWKATPGGWNYEKITNKSKAATSFSKCINWDGFTEVRYAVYTKQKDKKPVWSDEKAYGVDFPSKAVVSKKVETGDGNNKVTFSWSVPNSGADSHAWYRWSQCYYKGWFEGAAEPGWSGPASWTNAAEGSWSHTENDISYKPFCRKVTIETHGPRGSNWQELHHVFSVPLVPDSLTVNTACHNAKGYIEFRVTWTQKRDFWHPLDYVEFQYCISPPALGMKAPNNLSGTVSTKLAAPSGSDNYANGATQVIDKHLSDNECLFFRTRQVHDENDNYSGWVRALTIDQRLSNPSSLVPELSQDNIYTITATNNASDVPDSFLAIYYRSVTNNVQSQSYLIGIMPNGTSEIDVRIPEDPTAPDIQSFGIRAIAYAKTYYEIDVDSTNFSILREDLYIHEYVVTSDTVVVPGKTYYTRSGTEGAYVYAKVAKPKTSEISSYYEYVYTKVSYGSGYSDSITYYSPFKVSVATNGSYTYKTYELDDLIAKNAISSDEIWQSGEVPKPPTDLEVVTVSDNVAKATWKWTWAGAKYVELAWSESSDAWESTDEPSTYRIRKNRATSWNIHGLSSGTVWYFRARFIKEDGDTEVEGPWSKIYPLNLTSAPVVPELNLSKNIVTANEDFVASWVYASTDGTPQSSAEIFPVVVDNYGERRGAYRPASDVIESYDGNLTYYTYTNNAYVAVVSPSSTDFLDYYLFDENAVLAKTEPNSTQQQLTLNATELGLDVGQQYNLSLRLWSESGVSSEFSPMVSLMIVDPLEPPVVPAIANLIPESLEENGDYILTSDESIDSNKTYYTRSGEEGSYEYTEVEEPTVDDIATYYELETFTRSYFALKSLPMTFNVTGAGGNGLTRITIERSDEFFADTPDGGKDRGYKGEVVALVSKTGEGNITIAKDDLIGELNDGARYLITVTIIDENGQVASEEYSLADISSSDYNSAKPILYVRSEEKPYVYSLVDQTANYDSNTNYYYHNEFIVSWTHQPSIPEATVVVDDEHKAVKITTSVPDNYVEGDKVDIYRLSVDKPLLIVKDGDFGTTYVDPYPAFGDCGGHRVVYKSLNGDYITKDDDNNDVFSWIDLTYEDGDIVNSIDSVINYDGGGVEFRYNIDLSSAWKKDFKETKYLGGHIQGDWNPGVNRTGTISTVSVITKDADTIKSMRELADYSGIVHVRTRDGSSYSANVDVSETMSHDKYELATYSLSFTRVDSQSLDGMDLATWNELLASDTTT